MSQYEAVLAFPKANSLKARTTFRRFAAVSRTYAFPSLTVNLRISKSLGCGPGASPALPIFAIQIPPTVKVVSVVTVNSHSPSAVSLRAEKGLMLRLKPDIMITLFACSCYAYLPTISRSSRPRRMYLSRQRGLGDRMLTASCSFPICYEYNMITVNIKFVIEKLWRAYGAHRAPVF